MVSGRKSWNKQTRAKVSVIAEKVGYSCPGLDEHGSKCPHVEVLHGREGWNELWKTVADPHTKKCCYVYLFNQNPDIMTKENYSAVVKVPKGKVRTVDLRLGKKLNVSLSLEFELDQKSSLGVSVRGTVGTDSSVDLRVKSKQNDAESRFFCRERIVCEDRGKLQCSTFGYVGIGSEKARCEYDVKILQSGDNSDVCAEPQLEVLGKDVVATHGCSVGRIPDEALMYMGSRGVGHQMAEKLYVNGFLK